MAERRKESPAPAGLDIPEELKRVQALCKATGEGPDAVQCFLICSTDDGIATAAHCSDAFLTVALAEWAAQEERKLKTLLEAAKTAYLLYRERHGRQA